MPAVGWHSAGAENFSGHLLSLGAGDDAALWLYCALSAVAGLYIIRVFYFMTSSNSIGEYTLRSVRVYFRCSPREAAGPPRASSAKALARSAALFRRGD